MRRAIEERYANDPVFHALVEHIYHFLCASYKDGAQFTPTEVREAVFLATLKYEQTHTRPFLLQPQKPAPAKEGETT